MWELIHVFLLFKLELERAIEAEVIKALLLFASDRIRNRKLNLAAEGLAVCRDDITTVNNLKLNLLVKVIENSKFNVITVIERASALLRVARESAIPIQVVAGTEIVVILVEHIETTR